jgi:hypothetical protein
MIYTLITPRNREHFTRLTDFARDVLAICDDIGVEPIMDGSLAVFAYTRDPNLEVHDIDFSCSEPDFPQLRQGLQERGIQCEIRSWHVLQARRDGLKLEFGAIEHWMQGIPVGWEWVTIAGIQFQVLRLEYLREQYRRGLANTAGGAHDDDPAKHRAIQEKLRLLDSVRS